MLGILLIDKPAGITSHDVVSRMRRRFSTKRVGHAGTLDPIATGLLVVAIGPATRFLQYLPLEPKVYDVEFEFGVETTTYDTEGAIMARRDCPADLDAAIADHLDAFRGPIAQLPPMYSAVKKEGKALYEYARAGIEVERKERQVFITRYEPKGGEGNFRRFEIECSGGTYIRSLGHDLGQAIGCGAHVAQLRRTDVGRFSITQAALLDDASPEHLIPLREALAPMPMIELNEAQVRRVREGQAVDFPGEIEGRYAALLGSQGGVFSVGRVEEGRVKPECVIPAGAMDV
jgi:tRNA pseudouridine55 synthase